MGRKMENDELWGSGKTQIEVRLKKKRGVRGIIEGYSQTW